MSDDLEEAVRAIGALPLKRYCQITGESMNAIYQRKFKGIWQVGVHLTKPDGGDWWVDLAAADAWRRGEGEKPLVPQVAQHVRVELGWKAPKR